VISSAIAVAQVSITSSSALNQNYDGMGSSAAASLPSGFRIGADWSTGTLVTTQAYGTSSTGAVTSSSSGGVVNWANGVTGSSTDRALGFLTTSGFAAPRSVMYAFTNNTGATVISIDLSWDYEKYRTGTRAFDWTFFHGSTSAATTAATSGNQSYAADAANAAVNPPTSINKSFSITGLSIPHGSTYYLRWTYTGVGGSTNAQGLAIDNFTIKANPDPTQPIITGIASATAFTTTYGTASAAQSFPISGANLTSDILASAPAGFEVSSDGVNYGDSTTFPPTAGSVTGTLRIRLAATASAGTYNSQNISLSSTGASSVTITTASTGNSVATKSLTITGITAQNKNWDGTTEAFVVGTPAYEGLMNGQTFSVGGTVTWTFADANVGTSKSLVRTGSYLPPSSNYTVVQPSFSASILGVVPPAPTITAITSGNQQLSVAFTAPVNNGGVSITNYEYTVNGGSDWITPAPAVNSSPLLISGLTNGTIYDVQIRAVNAIGSGAASTTTQGAPEAPADATISVTPAILSAALSSTYGTASTPQNFTVSGSTLSGDLTVTAPTGLEVSLSSGSGYTDQLSLVATEGAVSATVVYVRLKASAAAGPYNSASVTVSGGGAVSQSTSTTAAGNTQATKELTVTGLSAANKEYDGTTDASVTGTAEYSGMVNGESSSPANTVTWAFANKAVGNGKTLVRTGEYAAPTANYTVTQPTLSANITAKNLNVIGAVVTTRPYNTNTTATLVGATLDGVIGSDVVSLTNDTAGTFAQANVGENIVVTTSMQITGTDATNYTLIQPSLTGTIVKADQTINFGELAARSIADAPFTISATATSTLPVTFANSNESVATLSGSTVTIVGLGSTTITASQAGDDNYNPAIAVERVLVITPVPLLWNFTGGVDTAASSPANVTVSAFSRGNNFGTTNTLINSTSPSTSSLGLSGTNNAGLAARTGVLNQAANGSGYFEFTVTPAAGFKSTITDFSFGARSTGTGPQAYTIRSSADGFVADLVTGTFLNDSIWALKSHSSLSIAFGSQQTFRIYGYAGAGNPSQNSTNWRVDDIRLLMTVEEKATPTITTAPTAAAITVGQTLASSTLSGGAASVDGSFAFTSPTTAPAVGISSESVTFTPTDSINYKSVSLSVDVTTNRNTPTITTAPTASAITVGQTLASSTLTGGVASVPGTFAFTSPTTSPAQGTSAQSVTFTPTDSTNYNSVTLNVNVTVNAVVTEDPLFTDASKNAMLSDFTGGAKRLSFSGIPGRVYGIQRSSDLTGWTQIGTATAPQDGSVTFDDPNPLVGKGFYRIVYPAADN
jgi:hypothetical protein